ncbi:MAG TPA: hypothetical protein VG818_13870 [Gemmatimonadaceae bacterium]|nr:hypothetical protein [Gemmatimonadaceae bacterium]
MALVACGAGEGALPTVPTLDEQGRDGMVAVSAGRDHTCALSESGAAFCWGRNDHGQLGFPTSTPCDSAAQPTCALDAHAVLGGLAFRTISAGTSHTCAITTGFAAWCWGTNADGELGSGGPDAPAPRAVTTTTLFAAISAGDTHTCAVATDGTAWCWGRNDRGQLGTGDTIPRALPTPVATSARFVDLSAGQARTCGRTTDARVLCWGAIWEYRRNGLEFTRAQLLPQDVPAAGAFTALSVGAFTTCGVTGGAAVCWEANPYGEMGNGTTDGSTAPVPVAGGLAFTNVSVGVIQACGVAVDGSAWCWGNDSFGQLGVPTGTLSARCGLQQLVCSQVPVRVVGWRRFVSVSTGIGNHACGVTRESNVYCWGLGVSGQLGFGGRVTATAQPLRVAIRLQ